MTDRGDRPIDHDVDDPENLLGAYVLDALDDEERARVEAYLDATPSARAEVDRLAESFDVVASEGAPPEQPPAELWSRISGSLPPRPERRPERRPEGPLDQPTAPIAPVDELAGRREAKRSRFGSNTTRVILSVAAAAIVVLVGIAVLRQSDDKPTSVAQQLQQDAETAATAPGSRTTTLQGDAGVSVKVVVDSSGRGYVIPESLPPLDDRSTYQLWSVDGGTPVSLGLLGADPGVTVVAAGRGIDSMAITAEPAGGSPAPTSAILASGEFT